MLSRPGRIAGGGHGAKLFTAFGQPSNLASRVWILHKRLIDPSFNLIWSPIIPILASSRRDGGTITLAGCFWEVSGA